MSRRVETVLIVLALVACALGFFAFVALMGLAAGG